MGTFEVVREVDAPAPAVWATLVDWPNHGRWVPLTRVWVTSPSAAGVGATFVGRTGIGPLSFDDPMEVTGWQPPDGDRAGRCDIGKRGRVVLGTAGFTVTPLGPRRCVVRWTESIQIVGVRRLPLAGRLNDLVGRLAFGFVLRQMAAQAEGSG